LLAHALGGRVFPGLRPEICFEDVLLTDAGRRDPIFNGVEAKFLVFHWHGDTFDLPQGAVLLASSVNYAHQAFRFGSHAYGLQFHVEPDLQIWKGWQAHLPLDVLENSDSQSHQLEQIGQEIIANFFDEALQ
jgi:GMP synthase (glutamine-hydrolysing)